MNIMENQPIEQITEQPTEQAVVQAVEPKSSAVMWYVVLAVVVIALGLVYFAMKSPVTNEAATDTQVSIEQMQIPAPTEGNTTADITTDLNQIPDISAALDADATEVANDLQSL